MKYDIIKPYIEKGLVSEQAHPEKPSLRIFNYTQECQFSRAWDEVTRQCRGLIMDIETGEIIARPFEKFFNYGEHVANGWEIPIETPIVTEKLDGSLGILYEIIGKIQLDTGCEVVLSSSWRHLPEAVEEIKKRVVPLRDITGSCRCGIRGCEINTWINTNIPYAERDQLRYAILDDDNDMLLWQKDHFFQTSFENGGLTEEIAKKVTEHLNV